MAKRYSRRGRPGKVRFRGRGLRPARPGVAAGSDSRAVSSSPSRPAARRHRGHGSLRLRPLLGATDPEPRPRGRAAAPSRRASLRPPQQDRPHRHQGHARGLPQRGDPARPRQDRRPADSRLAPSPPFRLARRAHRSHQHPARSAPRVRDRDSRSALEHAVPAAWALLEDADARSPDALRPLSPKLCREIRELERRVKQVERQLEATADQLPAVAHLQTIPGIGLIIATALVAFVGDIRRFPSADTSRATSA